MSGNIMINYHEALVFTEDPKLFKAPGWLNDRCLNFYFRVLEHEEYGDRPDLLFMDPAVVSCMLIQCTKDEELEELGQGLGLSARSLVFIPVNDAEEFFSGCTHWSLLVYCPAQQGHGKFYHLDSSQARNEPAARTTAAQYWRMVGGKDEPPFEAVAGCPQQENGYDCGMYVLSMAKYLAHLFVTRAGTTGTAGTGALETTGLASHVTADSIMEARRRIGQKLKDIAVAAQEEKDKA